MPFRDSHDYKMEPAEKTAADYREHDATKLRTGNTFEQMMQKSGREFPEVFGLTRDMKTLIAISPGFDTIRQTLPIDQILLDMEEYRFQLAKTNTQQSEEELDLATVSFAIRKYLLPRETDGIASDKDTFDILDLSKYPEIPQELIERVEQIHSAQTDDTLLNIGDPYEYVNRHRDRSSVTTVEYAPENVEALQVIRTLSHALEQVKEAWTTTSWGKPTYATYAAECDEWIEMGGLEGYDRMWYEQLDRALGEAFRLSETTTTPEELNAAINAWQAARQIHSKENFIIYNKVKMLLDLKLNTIPNAD